MAGALRSCSGRGDDASIKFLIVATGDLCERISEGLLQISKQRKYRTVVHQCESISQVVRLKPDLGVDFVVFAFDWRLSHAISEVEENIRLIDENFIVSGSACLVNCTGIPQELSQNFSRASGISKKLNLLLMTTKIAAPQDSLLLGNRLLNLVEARRGNEAKPVLPRPLRDD